MRNISKKYLCMNILPLSQQIQAHNNLDRHVD